MSNNKILAGILAMTIGITTCSCGTQKQNFSSDDEKNKSIEESIVNEVVEGQAATKDPYKHFFYIRIKDNGSPEDISGGSIDVPEGYIPFDADPFTKYASYGSETGGHDIWFVNTETVEVTAVYNESLRKYDYSQFGKVIKNVEEKEQEQEIGKKLVK